MKEFVKSITSPYEKELIETRRYLHRHPELSFQETDTAAYIRSTLNALGVPLMEGISGTSTVAVIKGEKTGPCIAFRADIDALPVEEENDLPFKSEVPGVMHACGHDIHTAWAASRTGVLRVATDDYQLYSLPFTTTDVMQIKMACRGGSTIVSFQHGGLQILRQGALPASEIERVLSDPMQ